MTENEAEDHARRPPSRLRRPPAAGPGLHLRDRRRRRRDRDRRHGRESRRERRPGAAARRGCALRRREPLRGLRAGPLLAAAELRVLLLGGRAAAALGRRGARRLLLRAGLGGQAPPLVQGRLQHRQLPDRRARGARRRVGRRRVHGRRGAGARRGGGARRRGGRLRVREPPADRRSSRATPAAPRFGAASTSSRTGCRSTCRWRPPAPVSRCSGTPGRPWPCSRSAPSRSCTARCSCPSSSTARGPTRRRGSTTSRTSASELEARLQDARRQDGTAGRRGRRPRPPPRDQQPLRPPRRRSRHSRRGGGAGRPRASRTPPPLASAARSSACCCRARRSTRHGAARRAVRERVASMRFREDGRPRRPRRA